jgi:hypothetical protein
MALCLMTSVRSCTQLLRDRANFFQSLLHFLLTSLALTMSSPILRRLIWLGQRLLCCISGSSWVATASRPQLKITTTIEALIRAEQVLHPEKHLVPGPQVTPPPLHPLLTRGLPAPPHQCNGSAHINGSPRQQNASDRSDSAHAGADRSDTHSSPLKQNQQSTAGGVTLSPYNEKPQGLGILQSPDTEGSLIIHDSPVTEDDLRTAVTRSATLIGSPASPMDLDSKILQIDAEILS